MAVDCNDPSISASQIKNSLLVKVASGPNAGAIGFRTKTITVDEAIIEPVIGCAEFNLGDDQMLRMAVGLSDSGKPALIFIEEA